MNLFSRFSVAVLLMVFFGSVIAFAAPTDQDQVIVPSTAGAKSAEPTSTGGTGVATVAVILLLAGAGGWFLWRSRTNGAIGLNKGQRQLAIEETRSLGNRQFLVVAGYQNKKFLLGVCPGKIELLAPLHDGEAAMKKNSE
jgi:flagellar protein FliO/FliZ